MHFFFAKRHLRKLSFWQGVPVAEELTEVKKEFTVPDVVDESSNVDIKPVFFILFSKHSAIALI
jgi:hypothetical protein